VDSFGTQSITGDKLGLTAINANNIVGGTITTTQIASNTISNTNIQTGAIENYSRATGLLSGMRNRIINGAMVIDQRNAGASVTPTADAIYTLDRWMVRLSQSSKFSVQQNTGSVTPPVGFTNYFGVTSLASTSLGAGDFFAIEQRIEGYNFADLGWGTANAKTITISFWVRSSLTGTFGGALNNGNFNRAYPFSYTISSANTWEQKSVTIAGDTTGTWLTTNGVGVFVGFGLGVGTTYSGTAGSWQASGLLSATGATSVVGTNEATFYITGVQLEVGSTATSFDYRPYGTELALCQRYCNVYGENAYTIFGTMGFAFSSTGFSSVTSFPVEMRAIPTVAYTGNTRAVSGSDSIAVTSVVFNDSNSNRKIALVEPAVASGLTTNRGYFWSANADATARAIFSAEL
jgi:hypothetical protein